MIIKKILISVFVINFSFLSILTNNAQALSLTTNNPSYAIVQKSAHISKDTKTINLTLKGNKQEVFSQESQYKKNQIKNKLEAAKGRLIAASTLVLIATSIFLVFAIKTGVKKANETP